MAAHQRSLNRRACAFASSYQAGYLTRARITHDPFGGRTSAGPAEVRFAAPARDTRADTFPSLGVVVLGWEGPRLGHSSMSFAVVACSSSQRIGSEGAFISGTAAEC